MTRHHRTKTPQPLIERATVALADLQSAKSAFAASAAANPNAPSVERRRQHAALRNAFLAADRELRLLVAALADAPYPLRSRWRGKLSDLDIQRQQHLFAEIDDLGVLPLGARRAIDTGMSGPDLHDHIHGRVLIAGSPERYGLDLPAATDHVDLVRHSELIPTTSAGTVHRLPAAAKRATPPDRGAQQPHRAA